MGKRFLIFLGLLFVGTFFGQEARASITGENGVYTVTTGNDLAKVVTDSSYVQENMTVTFGNDLTLPSGGLGGTALSRTIKNLTLDLAGKRFYSDNETSSGLTVGTASGYNIIVKNMKNDFAGVTSNSTTSNEIPDEAGNFNTTRKYYGNYNGFVYGMFGNYLPDNTLTFENCIYNYPDLDDGNVQPFLVQRYDVYFSGINDFNVGNANATQEFGEGSYFEVLNGKTTFTYNKKSGGKAMFNGLYSFNRDNIIKVDAGATLNIHLNSENIFYYDETIWGGNVLTIENNGRFTYSNDVANEGMFRKSGGLGGQNTPSFHNINFNLGANSETIINNAGPIFNYESSQEGFTISMGEGAIAEFNNTNSGKLWTGSPKVGSKIDLGAIQSVIFSAPESPLFNGENLSINLNSPLMGTGYLEKEGNGSPNVITTAGTGSFKGDFTNISTNFSQEELSALKEAKRIIIDGQKAPELILNVTDYTWNYQLKNISRAPLARNGTGDNQMTFTVRDSRAGEEGWQVLGRSINDASNLQFIFKDLEEKITHLNSNFTPILASSSGSVSRTIFDKSVPNAYSTDYVATFDASHGLLVQLNRGTKSKNYTGTVEWLLSESIK
ncbi:MAG: hypothetical protein LBM95_01370 [Lactobacillales bacterium]|jgi:hypothetical protein|nr:hypothetical protein [Lactobacillales bacterium]